MFMHDWTERDVQQDLLLHCCSATGTHIKYGSDPFSLLRAQSLCWTDKHSHTHTHTTGDAHSHTGRRGPVLQCRWSGPDGAAEATPLSQLEDNIKAESSDALAQHGKTPTQSYKCSAGRIIYLLPCQRLVRRREEFNNQF